MLKSNVVKFKLSRFYISLGSNVDRERYLQKGLQALSNAFGELTLSSLFESEAVGFEGAAFYNMVLGASTSLSVEQVCRILRDIEYANGREQAAKKYSPRTLDLDLLIFDDLILTTPAQIPRQEIQHNAFVLWPLAEIAGDSIHPLLKQTYHDMWQSYDKNNQTLRKVPFNWSQ